MRVLALANFPREAAATRFRVEQFVGPLMARGIKLDLKPFLSSQQFAAMYRSGGSIRKVVGVVRSVAKRFSELATARRYDALFVQREAMFFGPEIFERLFQAFGSLPLVLDLDDATYIPYASPTYGKIGSILKFSRKTDNLIKRAAIVTCGNKYIAEHVESCGTETAVIPTVVDTNLFRPAERSGKQPVVGWIGTHSTFQVLNSFFPVLDRLAERHDFVLRVIGSGQESLSFGRIKIDTRAWSLDREIEDFQSLDIGLYPVTVTESMPAEWILGKSGFKAIQYMAVGIPFVMSPVGVCSEIGEVGRTHLNATSHEEWYQALDRLLSDPQLCIRMGTEGRQYSLTHYQLSDQADMLSSVFRSVTGK